MEASIIDLRYRMKDVLKAIDRNEVVIITYRGKPKARLEPLPVEAGADVEIASHRFFGMNPTADPSLDSLRGGRFDAL